MISVVIPTLNEEKYIGKLLDSLKKQTYKNCEIIVVDGGSDDKTAKIALSKGIKLLTSKEGVSRQRNMGAKEAKGNLIVFMDADTEMAQECFLERINNEDDFGAYMVDIKINPSESIWKDYFFEGFVNFFFYIFNLVHYYGVRGPCMIVRKDLFDQINGFDESLNAAEDMDLFRRIGKISRIKYLKETWIYESPRRYRKEGYFKTLLSCMINGIFTRSFKKQLIEWKKVD